MYVEQHGVFPGEALGSARSISRTGPVSRPHLCVHASNDAPT